MRPIVPSAIATFHVATPCYAYGSTSDPAIVDSTTAFGLLTVIVVAALAAFAFVGRAAFQPNATELAPHEAENALRMVAVCCLIFVVAFLRVLGPLGDGVLALLSAIAGYVLGGVQRSSKG